MYITGGNKEGREIEEGTCGMIYGKSLGDPLLRLLNKRREEGKVRKRNREGFTAG